MSELDRGPLPNEPGEQIERLRDDQLQRWRQGQRILVEHYWQANPALQEDVVGSFDLICHEIQLRLACGEQPALSDYLARFPQYQEQLRLLFAPADADEALPRPTLSFPPRAAEAGPPPTLTVPPRAEPAVADAAVAAGPPPTLSFPPAVAAAALPPPTLSVPPRAEPVASEAPAAAGPPPTLSFPPRAEPAAPEVPAVAATAAPPPTLSFPPRPEPAAPAAPDAAAAGPPPTLSFPPRAIDAAAGPPPTLSFPPAAAAPPAAPAGQPSPALTVPPASSTLDATATAFALRWQEERLRGRMMTPEELCARHPELLPEVRRRIAAVQSMEAMLAGLGGAAPPAAARPEPAPAKPKAAPEAPMPGPDGYDLLNELGRGGMGVVYKARQISLKRLVALKVLLPTATRSREQLQRFRSEAEAVARLQHPNIVQIYEVGDYHGSPFFSMEYVEGGALVDRVRPQSLAPELAAQLLEVLARAMHYAHERGIIHRDLKPANILLTPPGSPGLSSTSGLSSKTRHALSELGVPKITDFGLAKRLDEESGLSLQGDIMGTPSYMPPEQARGETQEVRSTVDIYSLGAILYEAITGRPPFLAATVMETLLQVIEEDPVPPRRLQPNVPRDLETICLKCLAKTPVQRYATADDLADDLRRFLNDEPIRARPLSWWGHALKFAHRQPAVAALVSVCAAAVLGLVVLLLWHDADVSRKLHAREQELTLAEEDRRQAELKAELQQMLAPVPTGLAQGDAAWTQGDAARAVQEWSNAKALLDEVLRRASDEPALADLREQAGQLEATAGRRLREHEQERAARQRHQQFLKLYDEALFHHTLVDAGEDLPVHVAATGANARQALALFGTGPEGGPPQISPVFRAAERAQIVSQCRDLLLLLAGTAASEPAADPQPRLRAALRILDGAAPLGKTRAYHLRRAGILARLGDAAAARAEEDQAAALPPATAQDLFLTGGQAYREGRLPQAVQFLDEALNAQPDHFWAQYFRAVCYLRQRRLHEARAGLDACLVQRRDFAWLYVLRGYAVSELKELAAAEADYARALQAPHGTDVEFAVYSNRGVLRLGQKQYAEALADLQRAVLLRPDQSAGYLNLAQAYQRLEDWDAAAALLQQAIRLQPALPALYRVRAQLHRDQDDLPAAIADWERALFLDPPAGPEAARDHYERARDFRESRQFCDALAECDAALAQRPDWQAPYLLSAEIFLELKEHQQAAEALDGYLARLKGRPTSATAKVYRTQGWLWAQLGRYSEAIHDYSRVLELDAGDAGTYSARGWLYLLSDVYRLALRDFDRALELDPKNADAYAGRGYARVRLGQYRQAVNDADETERLAAADNARRPGDLFRLLFNASRTFAQAVRKADLDRGARSVQDRLNRLRYQDRAVQLLARGLAGLPQAQRKEHWTKYIEFDPAFAPIRRSQGYLRLAEEYGTRRTVARPAPVVPRP